MIKRLNWNKKTASAFAMVAALTIVLVVALNPREITIAENTTLDPVVWTFQRPNQTAHIDDELSATYASNGLSTIQRLTIATYAANDFAFKGDFVTLESEINATATNPHGLIESVHVVLRKDQTSEVNWVTSKFNFENLSLVDLAHGYEWKTQAYITLAGVNHTSRVYALAAALWSFQSPNIQSHQMEVAFEIVYYNGTAYNKVVQPFQLNIVGREQT